MSKVKILLSYHKPDHLFQDEILTPIHAGRENALKRMESDDPKLKWLLENTTGDNTGDNISSKNGTYNEMTTVYWAWKNYEALGNPEYIGFMHYRRHFIFEDMEKAVYECLDIGEDYYDVIKYSPERVEKIVKDCDFVCAKAHWRKSLYDHYKANHDITDLECTMQIVEEKYPEFKPYVQEYVYGQKAYFCNMFIFPRETFMEYASWFFDISFELEKRVNLEGKRLFVSEWLTGIFITYLMAKGQKGTFLPTMVAEGEHVIPLVLASDNNYALPMMVTMESALQTAKPNTIYEFHLLVSEDFEQKNKDKIQAIINRYPKASVEFLTMGKQYDDAGITIQHITTATYYRLDLPNLLPKVNKCIYLDVDLIVKEDLSLLFRTSVDDRYIAGVLAAGYYSSEEKIKMKEEELGIPFDQYVNAGVLLMNLAKMRQDNMAEKFAALLPKNFSSQDQDILNTACYGKIRVLPFKYNAMTKYKFSLPQSYEDIPELEKCYAKNEWKDAVEHPVIIHYADKLKPWMDVCSESSKDWWQVVEKMEDTLDIYRKYITAISEAGFGHYLITDEKGNARKIKELNKIRAERCREISELKAVKREHEKQIRRYKEIEASYIDMKNSMSFKVGRIITCIPRKIRTFFKVLFSRGLSGVWDVLKKK